MRRKITAFLIAFTVMFTLGFGTVAESYAEAAAFDAASGLRSSIKGTWMRSGNSLFNLRKTAKMKEDGYSEFSQLQGACTDGKGYAYFAYNRKSDDRVRIVKMKIIRNSSDPSKTTYKYVKTSKILKGIRHGNDMTYVPDPFGKGQDVIIINTAATGGQHPCYLGFIDPKTLTEKGGGVYRYWTDLSRADRRAYPDDTNVAADKQRSFESLVADHHGYSAISYNADKGLIVATVKTDRDIIILKPTWNSDRTLKKVTLQRYIRQNKINATSQGMDSDSNYIYTGWSAKAKTLNRNILQIYDWNGNHIGNRDVTGAYEMENVFHTGKGSGEEFYTSFNYAHNVKKTVKKKVKVKWKKVWKKVNGKRVKVWKYKKKKRKVKVDKLIRDSYTMYLGRIRN